jgi:hypothetical protein
MTKRSLYLLVSLAPMLAACTSADFVPEGALWSHGGEAVQRNIAAQLVNPNPPGEQTLTMSGERAQVAQDRYAKDQVRPPPNVMTSNSMGSGYTGGGVGMGASGGLGTSGGGAPLP